MTAKKITPTTTVIKRFFVATAVTSVGKEAQKFGQLILGRCPMCCTKRLSNQRPAIIVIGTKLKNASTPSGKLNFFSMIKGNIRDTQVTSPQAITVTRI